MRYTREDGCRAWLSYAELHPAALEALLNEFGSCEAAYDAFMTRGPSAFEPFTNANQRTLLSERANPAAMHRMMLTMQKLEMGILTLEDDRYPEILRNIADPPPHLFFRGDPARLSGRCITMIGSRNHSRSGERATHLVARDLSANGVSIVSGLAVGLDTVSLVGALDGGTPAIGVAACGLDVDYPSVNRALKERIIASGGVLISEYPPGLKALPHHFAVRNRIMSGLSRAVLVMECGIQSGSMLTVQHALDQGRDVYAYPGEPDSSWSKGAHLLLREGAIYFTTANDVLEDMGWLPEEQSAPAVKKALPPLTDDQKRIFALLERGMMSFDEIVASSSMNPASVSAALTVLQINGLVEALPGKVYKTAHAV